MPATRPPITRSSTTLIPDIITAFTAVLGTLHTNVANHGKAGLLPRLFTLLACAQIRRIAQRILTLLYYDPKPPKLPKPRHPTAPESSRANAGMSDSGMGDQGMDTWRPAKPEPALGRPYRAWLSRTLDNARSSAGYTAAGHLQNLLTEPDLIARIHADPRLARALRPLCTMLGVDWPDELTRPPPIPNPTPENPDPGPPLFNDGPLGQNPQRRGYRVDHAEPWRDLFTPPIFAT